MSERHYGLKPGMRGTHFVSGDAELEVVHTNFIDNNRAQYRYYGGEKNGREFHSTAENFREKKKEANCPECGAAVYGFFDHVDRDCSEC